MRMMNREREEIVETLKSYKRLIAIRDSLINNYDGVLQAQVLSDMPKGNSTHSQVESASNKLESEIKELEKEITRVSIWLNSLNEEERFIIEQIYIEERFINMASNKWCSMGREYHSITYWKDRKRQAINKIVDICTKSVRN
jgi:hypothetical protein